MEWTREGRAWPNREASRFVDARPHRWHVQVAGDGPAILLLHGTGASTHTWRDILPRLAPHATVIAPDLPGHALTKVGTRARASLPMVAEDLWTLCDTLQLDPQIIVGHSAGGALALQMARDRETPRTVIGINAALGDFEGAAAWLFPIMAKALSALPFSDDAIAASLRIPGAVQTMIDATGSRLPPEGLALYAKLLSDPGHVRGVLNLMSQWSVAPLRRSLPDYPYPVILLAGTQDGTVPPTVSEQAAAVIPNATYEPLAGLGHLAHEEAPEVIGDRILRALRSSGP